MAEVIVIGTPLETLILFALMGLAAVVAALIYLALRPKYGKRGGQAEEPYLSGEGPEIVRRSEAPSPSLFWGFILGYFRRLYVFLRDYMHTGRLSDWAAYMAGWLGLAGALALIVSIYALVWGWP